MSDFIANIKAQLDLGTAESKMQSFINKYKNDPIKLKVDLDTTSVGANNLNQQVQKQFQNAGKTASTSFASAFKSKNYANDILDFANAKKQIDSETKKLSQTIQDNINDVTAKQSNSWAKSFVNEQEKAYKAAEKFSKLDGEIASNRTLTWLKNNSAAVKDYGDALEDLALKQRNATSADELKGYNKQVNALKTEAASLGKTGSSLFSDLSRGFKQIGQFALTYGGIQKGVDMIMDSVSELKEIDSILTEISKTSDLTNSQIQELGANSFEAASQWGRTATDYLLGVQEMSRSGYYGDQAEKMAQTSILAQAAGDLDADMANSYLLASNAAYQYQGNVEKLNALLDGQNMIK